MDWTTLAFHRVDAARRRMHVPGQGPEASGALFLAKRLHEWCKAHPGKVPDLERLEAQVVADLESPRAQEGARRERAFLARNLEESQ